MPRHEHHAPRVSPDEATATERGLAHAAFAAAAAEEAVAAHMTKLFGEANAVLQDSAFDLPVDIHVIPPRGDRPHRILYTTGMSARPMTVPPGRDEHRFAELTVSLPADWPLDPASLADPRWAWPVRWLRLLARLPHGRGTWLGEGHTVPNGDPLRPFAARTRLSCMFLFRTLQAPESAHRVNLDDGRCVQLLTLYPLHEDELQLRLDKGVHALLDAFDRGGVSEVLDPERPSCLKHRLWST